MAKQASSGEPTPSTDPPSKNAVIEQERMRIVQTLLEQLFDREDATVKLIFNCLYDIGIINLIHHKIPLSPARGLLKGVAQVPKPIVKTIAMRWIRKNCPPLIVKWLLSQVKARTTPLQTGNTATATVNPVAEGVVEPIQPNIQARLDAYNREILKLTSQVKMLTVLLVGVTCTLGGGFAWAVWKDQTELLQPVHRIRAIDLEPLQPALLQALKPLDAQDEN